MSDSVSSTFNDLSVNSGLSVGGDTSLNTLNVSGAGTHAGLTQFTGIVTYNNFMISNATNQFNGTTTYNGNTTFAGKLTANDVTINEAFTAKKTAIYQSNAQVNQDLVVLGRAFIDRDTQFRLANVSIGKNLDVSGNTNVVGDLSLSNNLFVGNDASFSGSLYVAEKIGITNDTPLVTLDMSGATDAVQLPAGTTAQRPTTDGSAGLGYIRYNTTTSQFEGYGAGSAWGSLGGVTDVDQDTYISAETSANADNDELKFYTAGTERVIIDACGNIGIKNSTPNVTLDLSGATDAIKLPMGTTAERPDPSGNNDLGYIRFNTTTSQFEGYGAGNAWGSLGGVTDVDQDTYITAETSANADNDELKFFTAGTQQMIITSAGDVSFNKSLNLTKPIVSGVTAPPMVAAEFIVTSFTTFNPAFNETSLQM